jgi:hypothetical protein
MELKAPKAPIQDDSIMLIKGTPLSPPQLHESEPVLTDSLNLIHPCAVSDSSNLMKKKRGQGLDNSGTPITSEPEKFISSTSCRVGDSNSIPQLTLSVSADNARQ